jgi:hypothetical protein
MDFDAALRSPSVRDQSAAAIFLRAEGANGAMHLPALLRCCQAIDTTRDLDRFEESLVGYGAITMAEIVAAIGFDPQDSLHVSIVRWIMQSTSSPNISVAAHSVYGLGNLGISIPETAECLGHVVTSEKRRNEHEHVSLRAIALRALRRLDPGVAATFFDAPAFDEYVHAVEHWLATDASKNDETRLELQNELEWMTRIRERRTQRVQVERPDHFD